MEVGGNFEVLCSGWQIDQLNQFAGFRDTGASAKFANTNSQEATYQHLIERMGEPKRPEDKEGYSARSYNASITVILATLVLLFVVATGEHQWETRYTSGTPIVTTFSHKQYFGLAHGTTATLKDNTVRTREINIPFPGSDCNINSIVTDSIS